MVGTRPAQPRTLAPAGEPTSQTDAAPVLCWAKVHCDVTEAGARHRASRHRSDRAGSGNGRPSSRAFRCCSSPAGPITSCRLRSTRRPWTGTTSPRRWPPTRSFRGARTSQSGRRDVRRSPTTRWPGRYMTLGW